MKKKANIAVIGCGNLAQSQHISNLIKAQNATAYCFCDVNEETLKDLQRRFPEIPVERDYKKVLADENIDGVVIATKEDTHVSLSVEALLAGKHVYVEKPLAETPEECQKVMEAEKASGKKLIVGMNRRLAPAYRDAKKILDRNGGLKTAYYRISDSFSFTWGKSLSLLGQRLLIECCHIIDILRYFTGSEVESVYCYASRLDEDNVLLRFKNGACATLISSGHAPWETPKERFEAIADKGLITVDDFCELHTFGMMGEEECRYYAGHSHVEREATHAVWIENEGAKANIALRKWLAEETRRFEALNSQSDGYAAEKERFDKLPFINYSVDKGWLGAMEHFAEIILNDVPVEAATAFDAYQGVKVVDAIIESRDTGKIVDLI